MAVEHWEGQLGCGDAPGRGRAPAPHWAPQPRFPVTGRRVFTKFVYENQQTFQPSRWDRRLLETKVTSLKACAQFFPLLGTHPGSGGETVVQKIPQTYRERLSCVVSRWGLVRKFPLLLCWALLLCSKQVSTILPVLSSPTPWPDLICIGLMNPAHSTLVIPQDSNSSKFPTIIGCFTAGSQCWPRLQSFLDNSQESTGPRQWQLLALVCSETFCRVAPDPALTQNLNLH